MMTTPSLFTLILFSILSLTGCTPGTSAPALPGTPTVRVRLLESQTQITLASAVPPLMQLGEGAPARQLRLPPNTPVPLVLTAGGWRIGATPLGSGTLTVTPVPQGSVSVNAAAYRGRYRFVPVSPTEFDVINDVDIDSYLKGVVAREMLPKWDLEAYRAQAIVARTYALYEAKTAPRNRAFDLYTDTRSQVYGGIRSESDKSRRAVDDTAGVVVAHGPPGQEKIFKAYFSACCGGIGQNALDALGDSDIPPLTARAVGTLCSASKRFNNPDVTFDKSEITRRIKLYASRRDHPCQDMATLTRIDIFSRNVHGRPSRFVLTDARGTRYALRTEELRHALNTDAPAGNTVFSSFFTPVNNPTTITLTDQHGHGHGVGLCQYCAQALSERGTPHEQIVLFSYPQSKLLRAY
jgi:stage II sporulation protein D